MGLKRQLAEERTNRETLRQEDVARRRAVLIKEIRSLQGQHAEHLRKRATRVFAALAIATGVLTAGLAASSRAELHANIASYHNVCGAVHDGDSIEAMRELAAERQLIFERDENLSARHDEDVYVLRPDREWPARFGCKFLSKRTRLYRLFEP